MQSLAVKYRPTDFDQVVAQSATKVILEQQLASHEIKNAYLFCGPAGCGKTTCARIFANKINNGQGKLIELNSADNNSVEDVREIIQDAKIASLDSEYKVFILDEVHAFSNSAWQALLKTLEEPPAKSIFILCTTDAQKIPKTILSRVQRYDFQRIGAQDITDRLLFVINSEIENGSQIQTEDAAINYLVKRANGGMRDALTMLDKCLAYSTDLTLDNVIKALGVTDYDTLTDFLEAINSGNITASIDIINKIYMSGTDLKQFIKDFTLFVLDWCKWAIAASDEYISCPMNERIESVFGSGTSPEELLRSLIKLQSDIKWNTNPLARVEAWCITKE